MLARLAVGGKAKDEGGSCDRRAHVLSFVLTHAMEGAAGEGFVDLGCAHVERKMSAT